ncbi:MAG: hypothetical protein ABJG78_19820 [Cyclobacteriaceae bacterium]
MKKFKLALLLLISSLSTWSQTNTFPPSGNIGIGTTSPLYPIHISGNGGSSDPLATLYLDATGNHGGIVINSETSKQSHLRFSENGSLKWQLRAANQMTDDFRLYSWGAAADVMTWQYNTGNVGIGTVTPSAKLHVQDNSGYAFGFVLSNTHFAGHGLLIQGGGTTGNRYILQLKDAIGNDRMTIHDTGEVGIGTISTGNHKLAVEGTIGAREIKVEASGWSDFVFENDYELRSLEEIEEFISKNKHLPEIPSEAEVSENGINLGEMDSRLLQKIEELTLYMIDMNKRMDQLEKKNGELIKEISSLKKE